MDFLADYGLFLAKTLTLVLLAVFVVAVIAALAARNKGDAKDKGSIHVLNLNDELERMKEELRGAVVDPEVLKAETKAERKQEKAERKARGKDPAAVSERKRIFVLDFDGDTQASQVAELRLLGGLSLEEMTHVMGLSVATLEREWQAGRAWLYARLTRQPDKPQSA